MEAWIQSKQNSFGPPKSPESCQKTNLLILFASGRYIADLQKCTVVHHKVHGRAYLKRPISQTHLKTCTRSFEWKCTVVHVCARPCVTCKFPGALPVHCPCGSRMHDRAEICTVMRFAQMLGNALDFPASLHNRLWCIV